MEKCELCAERQRQITRLEAQVDTLQAALLDRSKPTAPTALPEKAADPVAEAIRDVSGTDAMLRKHLFTWVKSERAKPVEERLSPDALADKIRHWESPSETDGLPAMRSAQSSGERMTA